MSLQEFVPTPRFEEYSEAFGDFYRMERRDDGVLLVSAHTPGGPIQLSVQNHRSLGQMLKTVAADPENEVLILTGIGCGVHDGLRSRGVRARGGRPGVLGLRVRLQGRPDQRQCPGQRPGDPHHRAAQRVRLPLRDRADVRHHLAAEDAILFDLHYDIGSVPADGIHNAFQELLGVKRAAYALLTGEAITAQQALEWGMVNEVVPARRPDRPRATRSPTTS